jgi:hypothetical protein
MYCDFSQASFLFQRGQRGDAVCTIVKVEFNEKSYGDSPKVDCMQDSPAEFNFNSIINVTFEDPITLDEFACRPILCKL